MCKPIAIIAVVWWLATCPAGFSHDVPSQLPDPQSTAEAWNVVEAEAENIDALLDGGLLRDITFQLANTDASLRYLSAHASEGKDPQKVTDISRQLLSAGSDMVATIRDKQPNVDHLKAQWQAYRTTLAELERNYQPELLHAAVYICPMHPLDRHLNASDICAICGMPLIRRHLPASSVYEKPGEATMKLTVDCPPLVVGRAVAVKIHLARNDGSPVLLSDLLEMHTRKIHLLINDPSLGDYHHEHPTPTGTPGDYVFDFTPAKPGPYRIWADVVPSATSVQEYVVADIPAETSPQPLADRVDVSTAMFDGRKYALTLDNDGKPIHAGQTIVGTIAVSDGDGKPFTALEPIMGAFAHIVGFNEDLKTVIHIHPYGKPPATADERAGPAFAFKFYAPRAGFYRLYGQVQIGGVSQFPAFGVAILPAEEPATRP